MRAGAIYWGALLVTLAGGAAMVWGWIASNGVESRYAGQIAAFVFGILAFGFGMVVWRSAAATRRTMARLRAGQGVQGRWFIGPTAIGEFMAYERRRRVTNEWRPSRSERQRGAEVLWGGEDLVVGGTYWRITPLHYPTITGVVFDRGPPLTAVVRYRQQWANPMRSVPRFTASDREFRFPVTDLASAEAMGIHFVRVLRAAPGIDPRKGKWWHRGALVLAAIFVAMGLVALAFAIHDNLAGIRRPRGESAVLIGMLVLAVMGTPAALFIAHLARLMRRDH